MTVLMEAAGFQVELLETGNYANPDSRSEATAKFLEANHCSLDLRGDVIYCRGRKVGPVRDRWPRDLYYPS
jgi:hypothetical protein